MNFYSKYQHERLLVDGPAKTFRAVEISSGRPVFLHLFDPQGRLLFDTIAARFRDSGGRLTPPVIETGDFEGSLYVVTEVIEPFVNLPEWLESAGGSMATAPAPPPEVRPVAGSSTKEPGEFTRLFGPGRPRQAEVTQAAAKEPGAFTREFMVSPAPAVGPPAASNQPAWPAEPVKPTAPPTPEATKPAAQVWPKQQAGPPSDISDLFATMLPGEHVDVEAEQARAAQSAPPEGKPFRRAGTFTRMFGTPRSVRKMPQERPKTVSSFFDSAIVKPGAATPSDQKEHGPGEYTRMIAIPQQTDEAHPPPAQPIQPAIPVAAPHQGNLALVIAFILVGVLFIAVIILAALLYAKR